MIKFFRKFRQQLLTQNKVSKYLLYAIGEIVLVVIGILIALSINNWNEEKKTIKAELVLYQTILNDIELEAIKIHDHIEYFNQHRAVHHQVYQETQGMVKYDSSIPYQYLRLNIVYDLVMSRNYSERSVTIKNLKIKGLLEDYFKDEILVETALNGFAKYKADHLRPAFSRLGIHDTKVLFNQIPFKYRDITESNLINYSKLQGQFGTIELDQLLFDLGIKTSWVIYSLELLLERNEKLKTAIEYELDIKK